MFSASHLDALIRDHGLLAIGVLTLLESMGLPLPGESALIAAALYVSTSHKIGIVPLVVVAACGAILGDNLGYLIGRQIGYRMIARQGHRIGLTAGRVKLGRYLFDRWGAQVVFFGRFIAIVRTFTALLAGANRMGWHRFLLFNALGGVVWATLYGGGTYLVGRAVERVQTPVAIGLAALGVLIAAAVVYATHKHARELQEAAERAYPDERH